VGKREFEMKSRQDLEAIAKQIEAIWDTWPDKEPKPGDVDIHERSRIVLKQIITDALERVQDDAVKERDKENGTR
jgi:hypothetical protein